MSNNADLVDQSLIGTFRYFGLQERQIDGINYLGVSHLLKLDGNIYSYFYPQ